MQSVSWTLIFITKISDIVEHIVKIQLSKIQTVFSILVFARYCLFHKSTKLSDNLIHIYIFTKAHVARL